MSRIKVDRITDKAGTGAPILVNGMNVTGKSTMGDIVGAAVTFNSITGGSANFSSDVSIGGTLTYEDVKNVDSVGLITARNGINVTGGNLTVDTNTFHVDATNNRVLIGRTTTNTSYPLSVEADGNAENILVIGRPSDDISEIGFFENDTTTRLGELQYRQDHVNFRHRVGDIRFAAGGSSERLRIGSAGQIGIAGANYGTSGQVLTSQGSGSAVQWATPSSGGLVHVEGFTAPNTQYITFDNLTATNVSYYQIKWSGINFNESNYNSRLLQAELQFNGTWNTSSSPYYVRYDYHDMGGGGQTVYTDNSNFFKLNVNGSSIVNGELNIPMHIANGGGTGATKFFTGLVYGGSPNIMKYELYGRSDNAAARGNTLTGVRFFSSTGSDKIGMVGRMDLYKYVF